jgi:hypothetical protein
MLDHTPEDHELPLRDRLLAVGSPSADFQTQFQKEIRSMFIRKLSAPRRMFFYFVAVGASISALVCGSLALTEPQLPPMARFGLATGVLFGLSWVIAIVSILRRGEIDLKRDGRRIAQMVWVFTLLMSIFFCVVGMSRPDKPLGVLLMLQSLVFLISAAVYWLNHRIEESELNVKEKLLELELHLAECRSAP